MKKVFLLATAALVLLGLNSYGQDPDTSKIRIGKKQYTVIVDDDKEIRIVTDEDATIITEDIHGRENKHKPAKRMDGTWGGCEFGLATLTNADYKLELPSDGGFMDYKMNQSFGFNFNFAEKSLGLIHNYVGIVTGLGIEYQQFMLTNDVNLVKYSDGITSEPVDMNLNKNRFSMCYLTLPLMAEFQIPVYGEGRRIKLAAGIIGGVRLGARQVQKYESGGEKEKIKTKDDFYLRDFRYGFTGRIGYGDIAVFANYYPQTLFETGKGPEVFPLTFGIHFGG